MSFSGQYLENFTPADQQSNTVDEVSKIGDTIEQELHTELQALVANNVDWSSMSADGCRKFLAYVNRSAPNFTASKGPIAINIISASALITIPAGSLLISSSGEMFFNEEELNLQQGQQLTFNIIQGIQKTVTGTYDTYIAITESDIDLSTITLTIGSPATVINSVTTPIDGFMAFYFDGTLYIKIFAGPDVPSIQGQPFVLGYVTCDGTVGNINANTISQFQAPVLDADGNPVTYTLSHDAFQNGFNAPSLATLRQMVKYWLYVKDTITRVSDYLTYFLSLINVGDAYVYGDTEYYNLTGILKITGKMYIILVPANGGYFYQSDYDAFNLAINPLKDCAVLQYLTYQTIKYYFVFQFTGSTNNADFQNQISASLDNYFNVELEREAGRSLFGSFDLDIIYSDANIQSYNPKNLTIVPYYVDESEIFVLSSPATNPTGLTAIITDGTLTSISFITGGSGFQYSPGVVLTPLVGGSGAIAEAVITAGVITGFNIVSGGSGYTGITVTLKFETEVSVPDNIKIGYSYHKFSLKSGTIASATATLGSGETAGEIVSISVAPGGTEWQEVPVVVFTVLPGHTGTGAEAVAVLTNGVVTSISILSGGVGYDIPPVISFVGPNGNEETISAIDTVTANGSSWTSGPVTSLTVDADTGTTVSGGYGYVSLPDISSFGGGGADLIITPAIVAGVLFLTLISGGSGYTSAPTIVISGGLAGSIGNPYSALYTETQTAVEGVFNIVDTLGLIVGSHDYNLNQIFWTIAFPKGILQTYSELLNRGYLIGSSYLCVRELEGFDISVTPLNV